MPDVLAKVRSWRRLRLWFAALYQSLRALLMLRFRSRLVLNRALAPRALAERLSSEQEDLVDDIHWALRSAGRRVLPQDRPCLPQAIAAQQLLEANGIAAKVLLGVESADPERFRAHAWALCAGGRVVGSSKRLAQQCQAFNLQDRKA